MEDHNKPFKRSRSRPLNAISNTNMNCNYKVITVFIKLSMSVYMCRLELDSKWGDVLSEFQRPRMLFENNIFVVCSPEIIAYWYWNDYMQNIFIFIFLYFYLNIIKVVRVWHLVAIRILQYWFVYYLVFWYPV